MKHLLFVLAGWLPWHRVRQDGLPTFALAAALAACAMGAAIHAQAPAKPAAAGPTLSIEVTDRAGESLGDVSVAVTGPVDRSGTTSEQGAIVFRAMRAGTYRVRFEHEDFVTLERDIVIGAKPASISVGLTPLPEPDVPPAPPPAPEPAPDAGPSPRDIAPRTLSIPDFLDKHLIGAEPHRSTLLGCADGGTARLLQIRDPLEDQQHADLDEVLYIVAGAGVLRIENRDTKVTPGFFALVPRGVPHSIRRQGRNPLIALSILTGEPCEEDAAP